MNVLKKTKVGLDESEEEMALDSIIVLEDHNWEGHFPPIVLKCATHLSLGRVEES